MHKINYPELKIHKEKNDNILKDLNDWYIKQHNTDEISKFKHFIYQWILNHILVEDRKYFHSAQNLKKDNYDSQNI